MRILPELPPLEHAPELGRLNVFRSSNVVDDAVFQSNGNSPRPLTYNLDTPVLAVLGGIVALPMPGVQQFDRGSYAVFKAEFDSKAPRVPATMDGLLREPNDSIF